MRMEPLSIFFICVGVAAALFLILASLYRIVPADYAHVVIRKGTMKVYSPHEEYSTEGKSTYFEIPDWFFLFGLGLRVHKIPLEIIPINVPDFLAFDKDRARFVCNIVAFVTVNDSVVAAKRFGGNIENLKSQVSKVVQATTRDATTKRAIREIINDREGIINTITKPLTEALIHWGLDLRDIELVEFRDPRTDEYGEESHVIADISSIIEEQINSEMRQKNAEQRKTARLKEAEADESAQKREITRDEEVGKRKQQQEKKVFDEQKLAREAALDVEKVQKVKTQEIEKERQIVEAKQMKEVEEIKKQKKKLEGEGDRLMQEEQAKGAAAPIREKGFAEAMAKEKLQAALNKFKDEAIRALVAELIVEKDRQIGVELAKSLEKADLKVFAGSGEGKAGFDLGQLLGAIKVSGDKEDVNALLNRIGKPNDLGIGLLGKPSKKELARK